MLPYLTRAMELLPLKTASFLCRGDLQRIHTGLGKIWYERSRQTKSNKIDRYIELQQSFNHYKKAIGINPTDILAVRGIAETVAGLEFTFADLFPGKKNKFDALPLFKRVAALEPNGLDSNYSTAEYLHKRGLRKELFTQIQHCAKIYPLYGKLKKGSFYSADIREAIRLGLEEAVRANIMVQSAYFSLSKYWEEEKRFFESADYFTKALALNQNGASSKKHITLGRLLLKAGKNKQASHEFIEALKDTDDVAKNVRTIYYTFKKQNDLDGFIDFALLAETNQIKSDELRLSVAKAQIKLKLFEAAKDTLQKIDSNNPNALACFMLAELARREKDWDAMELSIQKATMLDPHNAKYFNILADALTHQKKFKSAAYYMQKALANDPKNPTYQKKLFKIKSHHD